MALRRAFTSFSGAFNHSYSLQFAPSAHTGEKQPLARLYSVSTSPSSSSTSLKPSFFKPRLVIFDKDGTLVCFHTMWQPWCTSLASRMEQVIGEDLSKPLFDVLGYDHAQERVRIGALAENTHPEIREQIQTMLQQHRGFSSCEAKEALDEAWRDTPEDLRIKLTGDCHDLFSKLKSEDIAIAICTSDSREGTLEFLEREKLSDYVDMVVCGDDAGCKPKPNPHNALHICSNIGVKPADTIMVGDTPADTLMGQQANLGLTVGVLSGVGSKEDLADADVIVSDVSECVEMILPPSDHGSARGRVHQGSMGDYVLIPLVIQRLDFVYPCSSNNVLLLEAGPKDTVLGSKMLQWKIDMPAALMYNLCDDKYNWYYHTEPQKYCDNRRMYWPRGKVWGGSSSLNAMVYIRGHAFDYDRWESEGADGWNYFNCLPYFKKCQTHALGGDDYRGKDGPLHVSRRNWDNPLHQVFLDAGVEAGHSFTEDVNGYQQEGVGWFDMTIKDGRRWNTASAYLRPALQRANLSTKEKVLVTRVIFEGKRAVGIEYQDSSGQTQQVRASSEVILSGGAINSPQLLMLSGVGEADHLRQMGIEVVAHVPGVGANLQDHLEVYVVQKCKQPLSLLKEQGGLRMVQTGMRWFINQTGPARTAHLESGGFCRSRPELEYPDIMFHFLPSQVIDHGRKAPDTEAFQCHVGPMRATSRGWLKLKSKDPRTHPLINPNYLSTEIDRWEMRQSIKLTREIFAADAFEPYRGGELQPGPNVHTDEKLDAWIRQNGDSAYHPSCTCKMGSSNDNMAVVDSNTSVFGVDNLRVVDSSIMPSVVTGNLNAPTIMLAERAADLIKGAGMLPAEKVPVYRPQAEKADNTGRAATAN